MSELDLENAYAEIDRLREVIEKYERGSMILGPDFCGGRVAKEGERGVPHLGYVGESLCHAYNRISNNLFLTRENLQLKNKRILELESELAQAKEQIAQMYPWMNRHEPVE